MNNEKIIMKMRENKGSAAIGVMKLRRILTRLCMVMLLLVGICYADKAELDAEAAAPVRTTYASDSEIEAIAQNTSTRHYLRDELWASIQPDRFQLENYVSDPKSYWSNNAIYYTSFKEWVLELPESIEYTHNQIKRNDVTDYGTYIIVTESPTERFHYICFDFDCDTNTFYIYDNNTKEYDYSLKFVMRESGDEMVERPTAHLVNISGRTIDVNGEIVTWTERDYDDDIEAFFTKIGIWDALPCLETDGFRLFLQYSGVLY